MSREWQRIRDQWEKARITDAQFISQSKAMGAHYGALASEMVRRDFGVSTALVGPCRTCDRYRPQLT
jgi:hypothetical protein